MTQEVFEPAPSTPQVVYVQQPARRTSGLAVASLVLGILWLGGLGALLAIIFGAVGLKQTKDGQRGGRGLAIAGLVLGIVGIVGSIMMFVAIAGTTAAVNHAGAEVSTHMDLTSVAIAEESYKIDHAQYAQSIDQLDSSSVQGSSASILHADSSNFCLSETDGNGTTWYETQDGNISQTPC